MKKEFLTYLPIWRPMQTRSHLLWRDVRPTMAICWFKLIADVTDAAYSTEMKGSDKDKDLRAAFVYAYARDSSKHAFFKNDQSWQLAWAYKMDRMMQEQLNRSYWAHASTKSPAELLGLDLHVTGIHPYSRKLKFNWVEVIGSLDVDLTWDYLASTMDRVSKIYKNRWADPRYGFATPETCPIPTCEEDLIEMDPFYMGLVLDTFMFNFISRYSWQSCRCCYFWEINHMLYWIRTANNDRAIAEQFKTLIEAIQLKPMLALNAFDGPYTDRIQELARTAFARVGTISSMIHCQLPATIIERMDSLVEEMEHAT